VFTEGGEEFSAENIILCMGTKSRKLGLPNEADLIGQGVSYCATCDGFFFRNKTVVVAGGGDTAITDALYLSKIAKKVYLVHRRVAFRAQAALVEKLTNTNVELVLDSTITELIGEPLKTVVIKNVVTGDEMQIEANGLFVAIGTDPNTSLLAGQIKLDDQGYIITDENMQTSLEGVYAAGDIRMKNLRQVITACADGAIAATYACL
jgi:thioredoxin reductase (NADPH)